MVRDLILVAVIAVIFGPGILHMLQGFGVKGAHRVGFPVGEFRFQGDPILSINGSTGWVEIKERETSLLISEQSWLKNPMQSFWTSGWPDKLVGIVEEHGGELRLVLRTDPLTSML